MDENHSMMGREIPPPTNTHSQPNPTFESQWLERNRREKENHRKRLFIDMIGIRAFEDYTLDKYPRKNIPAYSASLSFTPTRDNLYLWGPSWCGKTHLATALAHKFWDSGQTVLFSSIVDFKNRLLLLKSSFDHSEKKRFIDAHIYVDVLVLNEIGRGTVTDAFQEELWKVFDERIVNRKNGFIGTGNYSPKEIGERMGMSFLRRLESLCGPKGIIQFPPRGLEVL